MFTPYRFYYFSSDLNPYEITSPAEVKVILGKGGKPMPEATFFHLTRPFRSRMSRVSETTLPPDIFSISFELLANPRNLDS
jgi:hypothetical protein